MTPCLILIFFTHGSLWILGASAFLGKTGHPGHKPAWRSAMKQLFAGLTGCVESEDRVKFHWPRRRKSKVFNGKKSVAFHFSVATAPILHDLLLSDRKKIHSSILCLLLVCISLLPPSPSPSVPLLPQSFPFSCPFTLPSNPKHL